jgi:hypothetical protein
MNSRSAPNDPIIKAVQKWKKDQAIISLSLDRMLEEAKDKQHITEQKVDGQTAIMEYRAGEEPRFGSLHGMIMWDLPLGDDIAKHLKSKKITQAQIVGEMAGYADGKIIPFNESESLIKNPKADKTKVHWFPYEIIELNGEKMGERNFETYKKMWPELERIFKGSKYVHPVEYTEGDIKGAYNKIVEKQKNEGIVVRLSNNKTYKVKPSFSYDLVVIAVGDKKKGKNWPKKMISMALLAFMDNDRVFRTAGHVASGFTDAESRELFSWAQKNKVGEDEIYVWVKPQKIMQVIWERTTLKEMPSYKYGRKGYEKVEKRMSGTVVKPRFIRWRTDKSVNPSDLRLTQIPDWGKKQKMARDIVASILKISKAPTLNCSIFSDKWNEFVETWYYKIYKFLENSIGEFVGKLSGDIKSLPQKQKNLDINAQYDPDTGNIFLRDDAEGKISYLLGNLFHEMIHANIGDVYTEPFYVEGFTDYLCEVLTDNEFWEEYRSDMHAGFISSNHQREENAKTLPSQFNVDRWNGQVWARENLGPDIVEAIKQTKKEFLMKKKMARSVIAGFLNTTMSKTWKEIEADYNKKYGDRHKCHVLECTKCGTYVTCKCMTGNLKGKESIKPVEKGICPKCSGETGFEPFKTLRIPNASIKTWRNIQAEYETKFGKNHHCLSLECIKCGNTMTCRCSTPKTLEKGICYYCTGEIERPVPLKFE